MNLSRELYRKERAKAEVNRMVQRYDSECGKVHTNKVDPENLIIPEVNCLEAKLKLETIRLKKKNRKGENGNWKSSLLHTHQTQHGLLNRQLVFVMTVYLLENVSL